MKVTYVFHSILEVSSNIGRNREKCCWLKIHLTFWKNAQKTFQFLLTGYVRVVLTLVDLNGREYMRIRLHINSETQSHFCFIRYLFKLYMSDHFLSKFLALQLIKIINGKLADKMVLLAYILSPCISRART